MKLCDKTTAELVKSSFEEHTDLYLCPDGFPKIADITGLVKLTGRKTVCLFPSYPVVVCENDFCIFNKGVFFGNINSDILIADAGALFFDEFTAFMFKHGFDEIILLFADCAEKYSYGFSNGMRNIAEIRAALPFYIHITALFADYISGREKELCRLFGSEKYFSFSEKFGVKFNSVEKASRKQCFAFIAWEYEKSVMGHTAVFFDERLSAENFSRFLRKLNIRCAVFHGGLTEKEKTEALKCFSEKDKSIIAVTKSFLASAVFTCDFNAVYCGIPVTDTFAKQIIRSGNNNGALTCVYCDEDIKRNIKIKLSAALLLPKEEQKAFSDFRSGKLLNMINLLRGTKE